MSARSETVSFRLEPEVLKLLDGQRGKDRSRGDFAREIVTSALSNAHHDEVIQELGVISKRLKEIHIAFGSATAAILSKAGTVPEAEAKAWVRAHLYGKE